MTTTPRPTTIQSPNEPVPPDTGTHDIESINEPKGSNVRPTEPAPAPKADPPGADAPKHPHPDDKRRR
jgi:hypothetical protein